jgi:MtN3 and saliva related transmembrane protein
MDITVLTGTAAGLLTTLSTLPQIIKTIKTKNAEDVSIGMFTVLIAGVSLWVVYGIFKKDYLLIIFNSVAALLDIFMVILKFKFDGNRN